MLGSWRRALGAGGIGTVMAETAEPEERAESVIDPQWYRRVLGQYPTGVCVVTADGADGVHAGMAVGSFTSVSLEPPLIAFFPMKTSTSWPRIEAAGHFAVNILGADQEAVCRQFSGKAEDKFAGLVHRPAGSGAPILDGVVAWIDCDLGEVIEAGDHYIVLGRVRELQIERPQLPLLFFQGGYGRFSPLSLAAPSTGESLTGRLRHVDRIRPVMERVARELRCECIATARLGDEVVVLAAARDPHKGEENATLVGQRVPFMPPMGAVLAAWDERLDTEAWLNIASGQPARDRHRAALERVRERGYSVGLLTDAHRLLVGALERLGDESDEGQPVDLYGLADGLGYDPEDIDGEAGEAIRQISVPVFGRDGSVEFALTVFGFGRPDGGVAAFIDRLRAAADRAGELLRGHGSEPA